MIPYSKQQIFQKDIFFVNKVLKSNFLSKGPMIIKFENKISKFVEAKYSVTTNSGSSALHLACIALGVKKGDIVWTVPNTFAASANCALLCGANVDFVDIEKDTFNIDVIELEKKLIIAKKKNKLPKLVIPVHHSGQPVEQKKIWKLSKTFNFKILEDASHSLGASHYGEKVGSCRWSDITVFSFHPVKIITTGEGGVITTNSKLYYDKIKQFRENGIIFEKKKFIYKSLHPGYYEHHSPGYNYRMSEISAALGLSQLTRIKQIIRERNKITEEYRKELKSYPVTFQKIRRYNLSSFHLTVIKIDFKKTKKKFNEIFEIFRKKKIFVNLHYMPLHLSPFFKKRGFKKKQFPVAENYSEVALSIPNYPGLKKKEFFLVINII